MNRVSRMKVAIFGASGLVGRSLCMLLTEEKIDWVGTYNTSSCENSYKLDIENKKEIEDFLLLHKITHVINSVAERNVDFCEKNTEKVLSINRDFPSLLASLCKTYDLYFIHISTDYIFEGNKGPYFPDSKPTPLQVYGQSKLQAEENIKQITEKYCIIRVPVLYTQHYKNLLETAVTMIGKKVLDLTKTCTEDNYSIRRPVFIEDLCQFIHILLLEESTGTFHFYNTKDKVTKYQIAQAVGKYLGKSWNHIAPLSHPPNQAGRPYDTYLMDTHYKRNLFPETSLEEGIAQCFQKLKHPPFSEANQSIFYMIDLDGTLVDTDSIHYTCYKQAFEEFGRDFCSWDDYEKLPSIEEYCRNSLGDKYEDMKCAKNHLFQKVDSFHFLPGAERFLEMILDTKQNVVIVTNTSKLTVETLQVKLPLLQRVSQWITREDVSMPKPNKEPYELAKKRYWKKEPYIVGFENTVQGYESLKQITPIIYICSSSESYAYKQLQKHDVYFIPSFQSLLMNEEVS